MNVQQLYNFITKEMTPEEALLKLLKGTMLSYDKLKFENEEDAIHPELIITMAAFDLGWDIAIEKSEDENEVVRGIAVGTKEYLKELFKK